MTVGLSTQKWNAPAKDAIKDPPGAIAHEIGHALGLAT
jgi:hypothetical protein